MPEQGFLKAIFLSINRFQGRTALGFIKMKLIGEVIDNVLARTKFFDDSAVFQKRSQKCAPNFYSSWHCQLPKHSLFVADIGHPLCWGLLVDVQRPVGALTRLDPAIRTCTTVRVRRCNDQIEKSIRIFTKEFSEASQSNFAFRLRHASEVMRGIVPTRVRFLELQIDHIADVVSKRSHWASIWRQRTTSPGQAVQEFIHDFPGLLWLFEPGHVSTLIEKFEYRIPD